MSQFSCSASELYYRPAPPSAAQRAVCAGGGGVRNGLYVKPHMAHSSKMHPKERSKPVQPQISSPMACRVIHFGCAEVSSATHAVNCGVDAEQLVRAGLVQPALPRSL